MAGPREYFRQNAGRLHLPSNVFCKAVADCDSVAILLLSGEVVTRFSRQRDEGTAKSSNILPIPASKIGLKLSLDHVEHWPISVVAGIRPVTYLGDLSGFLHKFSNGCLPFTMVLGYAHCSLSYAVGQSASLTKDGDPTLKSPYI